MRRAVLAGNWKMNGSASGIKSLVTRLIDGLEPGTQAEMILFPPSIYLGMVSELIAGSPIRLGAQNASEHAVGAYTGEIAFSMLEDIGCGYVILGHSERRQIFGETSEQVAEKFSAAKEAAIIPILCVGETLAQREAGETLSVVEEQVAAVLRRQGVEGFRDAIVAYEPVWAIGTGLTASPEQAQEVHAAIRALIAREDEQVAEQLLILYGGSVNAGNAQSLFSMVDIDGGLVGGASLKAEEFLSVWHSAEALGDLS
jgi:triosephosphate isomerase